MQIKYKKSQPRRTDPTTRLEYGTHLSTTKGFIPNILRQ